MKLRCNNCFTKLLLKREQVKKLAYPIIGCPSCKAKIKVAHSISKCGNCNAKLKYYDFNFTPENAICRCPKCQQLNKLALKY